MKPIVAVIFRSLVLRNQHHVCIYCLYQNKCILKNLYNVAKKLNHLKFHILMIISHILLISYISLCLCTFYKHTHTIIHTNDYIHPSANGTENLCCFLLWAFFINPFVSSHIFCSHSLISNRYSILYICYGSLSFVFNNNVIIYKLYIF